MTQELLARIYNQQKGVKPTARCITAPMSHILYEYVALEKEEFYQDFKQESNVMTEAKKSMKPRRPGKMSPGDKAVAFVVAAKPNPVSAIDIRLNDIESAMLDNAHNVKESILSLRRNVDSLNSELNKQQKIYNNNFAQMEDALKDSWSYRIRSFMGL